MENRAATFFIIYHSLCVWAIVSKESYICCRWVICVTITKGRKVLPSCYHSSYQLNLYNLTDVEHLIATLNYTYYK